MPLVIPVILSGGSGSRLWPKSREHYPKQLHRLYGDSTMLQATVQRVGHLKAQPIVVCNQEQRFMVAEQLQQIGVKADIILEPVARNTAPAIAVAALQAQLQDQNAVIAVFPADHLIANSTAFNRALDQAIAAAAEGHLVTFAVTPKHPETGYGYLQVAFGAESNVAPVQRFVEKPDLATAEAYLASGEFFWNSGMFVFPVRQLLQTFAELAPQTLDACKKSLQNAKRDLDFIRLSAADFSQCASDSIDYCIMEKTDRAAAVPLDADWSDVGSWQALWEVSPKDGEGNVCLGDVLLKGSRNCYVNSDSRLVSLVGVEDLIVVETADSVLVAHRDASQDVKHIVERLKAERRSEYQAHREVFRPWGSYDLVTRGDRYMVKRIRVRPGASLSLQLHHHRAEHWVVVTGTALVQRGEDHITLTENQSLYIPLGMKHRLSNPGKIALELIEVGSGSYLEEDDIQRFEDDFGRECSAH